MSASLRPSHGVSTVSAIALNPALSALLTNCSTTFLYLYGCIYGWKKQIQGPVEATSSTLEVAQDDCHYSSSCWSCHGSCILSVRVSHLLHGTGSNHYGHWYLEPKNNCGHVDLRDIDQDAGTKQLRDSSTRSRSCQKVRRPSAWHRARTVTVAHCSLRICLVKQCAAAKTTASTRASGRISIVHVICDWTRALL